MTDLPFERPGGGEQWFLVAYVEAVGGPLRVRLREVFGPQYDQDDVDEDVPRLGPLPFEAGPFSRRDARRIQQLVDETPGFAGQWRDDCFLWQPPLAELPVLGPAEALALASKHGDESAAARRGPHVPACNQLQGYSLPRCWAFLLYRGPHVPAGEAMLVDRHTRRVIARRYADLDAALRQRGYSVPQPTHRQLAEQDRRLQRDGRWVELLPGDPSFCPACGRAARVGVPCCGVLPPSRDWIPRLGGTPEPPPPAAGQHPTPTSGIA